jgi:mono/diheme cytochrome c family protein
MISRLLPIKSWRNAPLLVFLGLFLGACGLASEPPILRTAVLVTRAPTLEPNTPPETVDLERGAELFAANCAACHGERGEGDGPTAASFTCELLNFTDADAVLTGGHSLQSWYAIVTDGNGSQDVSCLMPPWRRQLSDQDRWNVTSYAWSLHAGGLADLPPSSVAPSDTLTISGTVRDGTGDSPLNGQALTLRLIEQTANGLNDAVRLETTTTEDGSFTFADVPRRIGVVAVVSTEYAGIQQFSDQIPLTDDIGAALDLSFDVFATTSDPAGLEIEVMEVLIELVGTNTAVIQQAQRFNMADDRILLPNQFAPSVRQPLPANAQSPQLGRGVMNTFRLTPNGVEGSGTIYPIENAPSPLFNFVQVAYSLNYTGHLPIEIPIPYPARNIVVRIARDDGARIQNPFFMLGDPIQFQEGGVVYDTYTVEREIQPGGTLQFTVLTPDQMELERNNTIVLMIAVAALFLLGTLALVMRMRW